MLDCVPLRPSAREDCPAGGRSVRSRRGGGWRRAAPAAAGCRFARRLPQPQSDQSGSATAQHRSPIDQLARRPARELIPGVGALAHQRAVGTPERLATDDCGSLCAVPQHQDSAGTPAGVARRGVRCEGAVEPRATRAKGVAHSSRQVRLQGAWLDPVEGRSGGPGLAGKAADPVQARQEHQPAVGPGWIDVIERDPEGDGVATRRAVLVPGHLLARLVLWQLHKQLRRDQHRRAAKHGRSQGAHGRVGSDR